MKRLMAMITIVRLILLMKINANNQKKICKTRTNISKTRKFIFQCYIEKNMKFESLTAICCFINKKTLTFHIYFEVIPVCMAIKSKQYPNSRQIYKIIKIR